MDCTIAIANVDALTGLDIYRSALGVYATRVKDLGIILVDEFGETHVIHRADQLKSNQHPWSLSMHLPVQ
jgi:hypothetical protein